MSIKFANRMENLKASEIRELLKLTEKPEVISFAGGLPAPELFPVDQMKEVAQKVLEEGGTQALQYATTEGFIPLRKLIAKRMNEKFKTNVDESNILIISGSQQGLDFSGKIFLNEGDVVLCESPSYLGALNAFKAYGPKFIEVPTDENGMIMEELEKILETTENVKMIYVIPDFQNPTGRTWPIERRKKFMEIVAKYEVPVIEDNPYGELRFEGEILPSLKSMDEKGLVVFLGTFSKTFCPGLRVGWVAADHNILEKYIMIKQSADLQTSTIAQREIAKFMEIYDLDEHVEKIKKVYKKRRDLMINTIKEEFPQGLKYTYPEGGLFTWVELPSHINARDVLIKCLENNVAFVPGGSFFPNGGKENTFRLNYSNMPEDKIVEGVKRLGKVLREFI
ncbi:2-aminoadipate transaminase [Alkalithermobacter thermoalcaliphilus JW-YL-7 = DSM 7308]|uniref:2-aminoadipate transaminase n=1 Tax=Alkalithermobacter thermoalcaliphilus JW-YL-7 = DSM 7308 TaxID=1121328 RepID=A0A150FSZ5_CLOPD|nr:putative transcriptional regulator, GntR family [[Clostridium] paradoxum JW-YL-7 = DSM 7308]SHL09201.1 2-aminoadipate transaminase [[Clostridium] paradoxum JW-YL-7 = DSM 7308]